MDVVRVVFESSNYLARIADNRGHVQLPATNGREVDVRERRHRGDHYLVMGV